MNIFSKDNTLGVSLNNRFWNQRVLTTFQGLFTYNLFQPVSVITTVIVQRSTNGTGKMGTSLSIVIMTMKRITGLRLETSRVNRRLSIPRNKHDQNGDRIQILCDHSSLVRRPFRRTQRGLIYSHCFPSNPVHIDVIVEMMIIYSVLWSNGLFTHVIS